MSKILTDNQRRYQRNPGINETPVEDDMFLIAAGSGDIYHLDPMALSIWRALDEPASAVDLSALFQDAFPGTSAANIDWDLTAALTILLNGGLIKLND